MAACSAGVCDDLTSGALLYHYSVSRQSCYMFLLLPFHPHWNKKSGVKFQGRFWAKTCANFNAVYFQFDISVKFLGNGIGQLNWPPNSWFCLENWPYKIPYHINRRGHLGKRKWYYVTWGVGRAGVKTSFYLMLTSLPPFYVNVELDRRGRGGAGADQGPVT